MFTEEQNELFDAVYSAQMADSSLLFKWEHSEDTRMTGGPVSTPASSALRHMVLLS